nr:MAG TPA: hypothetical protein [Caudoviricetes sp.]
MTCFKLQRVNKEKNENKIKEKEREIKGKKRRRNIKSLQYATFGFYSHRLET